MTTFQKGQHIYFIGIGGISMSGLAEILADKGCIVSGTDIKESPVTKHLQNLGIHINFGHKAENITDDVDLVVYTAAIHPDNPEYQAAQAKHIPLMDRARLLGEIMAEYKDSIAVAGTHGKTTTTSMVSEILLAAGTDPTITVGGILPTISSNLKIGHSPYFVAEACEYFDSFLQFKPFVGVILNVESDHLDYFKNLANIRRSFHAFAERLLLTSANSINVARFLPQAFYYFYAYAQLKRAGRAANAVICVPSGNFGNITAGLFGKKMGLPIRRFIAANNRNDIFYQYLQTGRYNPRPSVATIANAMDVGDPSNFARVLDLYGGSHAAISAEISGAAYTDEQIAETVKNVWTDEHYLLDPHGACGFRALQEGLQPGETGVFLETAHPAKFKDTVENIIGEAIQIPEKLQAFMRGEKKSLPMSKDFADFKRYLMNV